ncbi:MAG TPA: hypothetical protein VIS03_00700, partial [Kiloniellaceae bacterium]
WLERAAAAPPDPAWVCERCGAVATRWSATCGSCHNFDSLHWRLPRRVGALPAGAAAEATEALTLIAPKPPVDASAGTAALPSLPTVSRLPGPPDRVRPAEEAGRQPAGTAGRGTGAEDDDDDEAAAIEGYLPPRPS